MARLTRTQKYAELREKMAHDSEAGTLTPELSKYDEKLNELDELFKQTAAPTKNDQGLDNNFDYLNILNDIKIDPIELQPQTETKKEPKPVEEVDTIEKISQDKAKKVLSIEEMVENMVAEVEKEIRSIAPVEARPTNTINVETLEPIKEETPVVVEEPVEKVTETIEEIVREPVKEETPTEETVTEVKEETPVAEETPEEEVREASPVPEEPAEVHAPVYENEFVGMEERANTIISVMDPSLKPEPVKEEELAETEEVTEVRETPAEETKEETVEVNIDEPIVIEEPVLEETAEETKEETAELEEPKEVIDNGFVNLAIEEAKNYNLEKGNETIDTIPETIIEKTRHAEVEIPEEEEEKDVANTISMELNNVLNSLNEEPAKVNEPAVDETKVIEKVAEFEETKEPAVEEHHAIAKELEKEEDVVEIKNITETLKIKPQVDSNVLDDTIPFDVAGSEEEEDEDDLPSKTLNIILGVLIGVLVLVLLVIVYYILVARGIIG